MGTGLMSDLCGQGYCTSSCWVDCGSHVIINRVGFIPKYYREGRFIVIVRRLAQNRTLYHHGLACLLAEGEIRQKTHIDRSLSIYHILRYFNTAIIFSCSSYSEINKSQTFHPPQASSLASPKKFKIHHRRIEPRHLPLSTPPQTHSQQQPLHHIHHLKIPTSHISAPEARQAMA